MPWSSSNAENNNAEPVASLVFRLAGRPNKTTYIRRGSQFDIGREQVQQHLGVEDVTISKHHLRIRCVMFDEDHDASQVHVKRVPPLIYVRVLSSQTVELLSAHKQKISTPVRDTDGDILLVHGDTLQINTRVSIVFSALSSDDVINKLGSYNQREIPYFANKYHVTGRLLGTGACGRVFLATQTSTGQQVACKIVRKTSKVVAKFTQNDTGEHSSDDAEARLAREYSILRGLSHPNIIQLKRVFVTDYNLYIMQELIAGGDLLSWMERNGPSTEPQAAVIIRQLLKAVQYLHSKHIVHRDIKPENILLTSWRDGARIVLTDFGHAWKKSAHTKSTATTRMQTQVGTPGYIAPEIYRTSSEGYSSAVDIWSIGCITVALPEKQQIFQDGAVEAHEMNDNDLHRHLQILETGDAWQNVSQKMKSFIRGCVVLNEKDRLSAEKALHHPWFLNEDYGQEIEAAYQRAIETWKPNKYNGDIVQYIKVTIPTEPSPATSCFDEYTQEVKSHHFTGSISEESQECYFGNADNTPVAPLAAPRETPIESNGERPTMECINNQEAMLENTILVPCTPPATARPTYNDFLESSISEYAPPWTQTQHAASQRPNPRGAMTQLLRRTAVPAATPHPTDNNVNLESSRKRLADSIDLNDPFQSQLHSAMYPNKVQGTG